MRRGNDEDGDIFEQQEETEAIIMNDPSSPSSSNFHHISCLMIMIIIKSINENFFKKTKTILRPKITMLTTLIVLALLATCYSLALVCAAQSQQHQVPNRNSHNNMDPPKLTSSEAGNSIVSREQEERPPVGRQRRSPVATAARQPMERTAREEQLNGRPPITLGTSSIGNRQASGSLETTANEQPMAAISPNRPPSSIIRNVTAQNGQSVLLHCNVEPSGELVVSWFRGTGEPQLLTYESNTVIDDERFLVRRHGPLKDDDWALQIKNLDKATDSGLYQCQTNSEPPQSQFYQLNIIEPQVNILGAPDMAVKLGSAINLTCVISQSPDQLQFIFWYRNDRMINYDINGERGKIVISKWAHKQDTIASNLQIFHSKLSDSGNYTCSPSGARPMSIYVHVLEGLDKRLIMFQNDNYEPSAASSQQTNSALSVHVVRLSRGKVYALFVAYVIFASWFQLVTQAQTAVSLLLLSIIGFFLGKVTENNANSDNYPLGKQNKNKNKKREAQVNGDRLPGSIQQTHSTATLDPLIRRANSALNLLKSLSSGSSSSEEDEEEPDNSEQSKLDGSLDKPKSNQINGALNSPSGISTITSSSSSSSSASTGYNSDSRSNNLIAVHPIGKDPQQDVTGANSGTSLHHKRRRCRNSGTGADEQPEETCEMIELLTEPTAMKLVMDGFIKQNGRNHPHRKYPQPIKLKSAPSSLSLSPMFIGGQTSPMGSPVTTPIKPPRIEPQAKQVAVDSHYSSPVTNTLAYPGPTPSPPTKPPSATIIRHSIVNKHSKSPSFNECPKGTTIAVPSCGATCDHGSP